jgi:hypothetical protein
VTKTVPAALQHFRALAGPLRLRVTTDAEGFPTFPGRYGRIEWFDGRDLAVYCDRPRLFAKLWAIPGVRRWQVGDQEMRALFPVQALPAVAGLIRARRRRAGRPLTSDQALRLRAGARVSATSAA